MSKRAENSSGKPNISSKIAPSVLPSINFGRMRAWHTLHTERLHYPQCLAPNVSVMWFSLWQRQQALLETSPPDSVVVVCFARSLSVMFDADILCTFHVSAIWNVYSVACHCQFKATSNGGSGGTGKLLMLILAGLCWHSRQNTIRTITVIIKEKNSSTLQIA